MIHGKESGTLNAIILLVMVFFAAMQTTPFFAEAAPTVNTVWTQQTSGISGSSVVGMAIDPTATTTVYALTSGSGVFKSTNSGASWSAANSGLPANKSVTDSNGSGDLLALDQRNHLILYANFGGKIFKTTDGASTWSEIDNGIDACGGNYGVAGVLIDPQDSTHLLAGYVVSGCVGGLYTSSNSGSSWSYITTNGVDNDFWRMAMDPTNSNKIYLATVHIGFASSSDGGSHWRINNPAGAYSFQGATVYVHPTSTSRIFYSDGVTGLYLSTDSGSTWISKTAQVSGGIFDVKFASSSPTVGYAAGSNGFFKTSDGGFTWAAIGNMSTSSPRTIAVDPTNANTIYVGSYSLGVFKSTNGGTTFTATNSGIPTNITGSSVTIDPTNSSVYYASMNGLGFYRSSDSGYNWVQKSSATSDVNNSNYVLVDPTSPSTLYAGFGSIYKSTDSGANWSQVFNLGGTHFFQSGAIDPSNNNHILIGDNNTNKLYESTNGGTTWATSTTFVPGNLIYRILFDPTNSNRVYAATYNYFWRSTDNGTNWTRITTGFASSSDDQIDDVAIDPTSTSTLYAATRADHIMKSTNGGTTWSVTSWISTNHAVTSPSSVKVDSSGNVYGFDTSGWQKSSDHGATWTPQITTGANSSFYIPKFAFTLDPANAGRFILGDFFQGVLIYENYVPTLSSSITYANDGGSPINYPEAMLTYTVSVSNSGPSPSTNTTTSVAIPSGLDYVAGSAKIDNLTISDPASLPVSVDFPLQTLLKGDSITVSFKGRLMSDNAVSAIVKSSEDPSGESSNHLGLAPFSQPAGPIILPIRVSATTNTLVYNNSFLPISVINPTASSGALFSPGRTLSLGNMGADVRKLQRYLNSHGFLLAQTGAGSTGKETDYFGTLTKNAVIKLQDAHKDKILIPGGFKKPTGMSGPLTQKFISENP